MPSFLVTSTALLLTTTATTLYLLHTSLKSRVHHESHRSSGTRLPPATTASIMTVPPAALTTSYRIVHDSATQRIPRSQLPSTPPLPDQFTLLVRRNMGAFARFPQAWMLRLTSPAAQRHTFTQSHIQALDFNEGDVVCAVYPVLRRSENAVEMGIRSPQLPSVEGRLVIRCEEDGDEVIICSETVMWTGVDETAPMPLEIPFVRFMHETASWWLLDSGVRYLVGLGRSG